MKGLLVLTVMSVIGSFVYGQKTGALKQPEAIIFDTDIGPDYDDVGAITLLHALGDSGECKILATMGSNKYNNIAAVLSVFNIFFNRPDIPIGVVRGKAANMGVSQKWDSVILTKYPYNLKSNEEAADALELYRKILSAQKDQSVTIVTVGFLTNMANLLQSRPDGISPLSGRDLVRRKVKKLVCMAARFDQEMGKFREYNVVTDSASSKTVFDNWPTTIIFSGFEIGMKIHTGLPLINSDIQNSPVKDVFQISIPMNPQDKNGRMSWDQTAVLIAVRGYERYYGGVPGKIICNANGSNGWKKDARGHIYITEKTPSKEVEALINELMMHQPLTK